MSIPTAKLPGSYTQDGKYRTNRRAAKLIRANKGQIMKYRDLPVEAQLAMAQYMSIDGEAWALSPGLENAMQRQWKTRSNAWHNVLADFLPFYVENYGDFDFGYIEAVPLADLIESVMADIELKEDWKGLEGWQQYHDWYMGHGSGPKHTAASHKPWPVILSCFPDETLQDGWTRFHQYVHQKRQTCPALWYPHRQSRQGALVYKKLRIA